MAKAAGGKQRALVEALRAHGPQTPGELAERLRVCRSELYAVLERLCEGELVGRAPESGPSLYFVRERDRGAGAERAAEASVAEEAATVSAGRVLRALGRDPSLAVFLAVCESAEARTLRELAVASGSSYSSVAEAVRGLERVGVLESTGRPKRVSVREGVVEAVLTAAEAVNELELRITEVRHEEVKDFRRRLEDSSDG